MPKSSVGIVGGFMKEEKIKKLEEREEGIERRKKESKERRQKGRKKGEREGGSVEREGRKERTNEQSVIILSSITFMSIRFRTEKAFGANTPWNMNTTKQWYLTSLTNG